MNNEIEQLKSRIESDEFEYYFCSNFNSAIDKLNFEQKKYFAIGIIIAVFCLLLGIGFSIFCSFEMPLSTSIFILFGGIYLGGIYFYKAKSIYLKKRSDVFYSIILSFFGNIKLIQINYNLLAKKNIELDRLKLLPFLGNIDINQYIVGSFNDINFEYFDFYMYKPTYRTHGFRCLPDYKGIYLKIKTNDSKYDEDKIRQVILKAFCDIEYDKENATLYSTLIYKEIVKIRKKDGYIHLICQTDFVLPLIKETLGLEDNRNVAKLILKILNAIMLISK